MGAPEEEWVEQFLLLPAYRKVKLKNVANTTKNEFVTFHPYNDDFFQPCPAIY
jgi:hypothetical protein